MDHTLPTQVRRAVLSLKAEGKTYEEIAVLLGIGPASVSRILRLARETGQVERRARGGGLESPIHGKIAELLCLIVSEANDATAKELTKELVKRAKIKTSRSAIVRALVRLGFTRKKSRWLPPNETPLSIASSTLVSARSSPR